MCHFVVRRQRLRATDLRRATFRTRTAGLLAMEIGRKARPHADGNAALAHINVCDRIHINMRGFGTVQYADFLKELGRAGLSVREFAGLIGMNPNSISNYARSGELPTHLSLIAVLIAGINELGGDYRQIMSKVELLPKKPRGGARRGRFGGNRQLDLGLDV